MSLRVQSHPHTRLSLYGYNFGIFREIASVFLPLSPSKYMHVIYCLYLPTFPWNPNVLDNSPTVFSRIDHIVPRMSCCNKACMLPNNLNHAAQLKSLWLCPFVWARSNKDAMFLTDSSQSPTSSIMPDNLTVSSIRTCIFTQCDCTSIADGFVRPILSLL